MKKVFTLLTLLLGMVIGVQADVIGYTEAINGTKLDGRVLTGMENVTISSPIWGSAITDQGSKNVYIDNTSYTNTKSWRKSVSSYDNQYVGYQLTIASGYKLNISKVAARIAVADDIYTWYVEILNASGIQVWKSGEKTTKKASAGTVDADVSETAAVQGLTGTITVNLYVKQGGSTKYFSINYLQLTATTEVDDRATYTMTTSLTPDGAGIITPADGTEITEGENAVFSATPNTGYKFIKWTIDGVDYTENPYTIENVTAAHTAVATFEALPKITFAKDESDADILGTLPGVDYAEAGTSYTLPRAYFLTKEGYTLTGWNDGSTTYAVGDNATIEGDVIFTAVFTANTDNLGDAATAVTWPFATDNGAPTMKLEGNTGYYVWPATVNSSSVDVAMFIDTRNDAGIESKRGKVDMQSNRAQVNGGTVFTIPAVKGMTVTVTATNITKASVSSMKFNGADADEYNSTAKTLTYTYTGSASTLTLIDQGDDLYPSAISVAYPVKPTRAEVALTFTTEGGATEINKGETLATSLDIDATDLEKYNTVYSSSNTAVAIVSTEGVITAVKAGTVTITATVTAEDDAEYDGNTATVNITVVDPSIVYISKKWDFTAWSAETVDNLKTDAAASSSEGWSDIEKATDTAPSATSKDNCFWYVGGEAEPTANGTAIAELKGLEFNTSYGKARSLAIAVNYPEALSTYEGPSYLWLGGKGNTCFTIKNVKVGSDLTMKVESHKTTDARGVQLFVGNQQVGEDFTPKTAEVKTWNISSAQVGNTETVDIVVKNTNGCHIYYIDAEVLGESIAIGATGWATTVTNNALDFSASDVKAYTAKLSGTTVTLEEATEVPAGTALVVKGTEGSHSVPVIASAAAVDNDLKGSATEATVMDGANTYYGLTVKGDNKAQFAPITAGGTIAAGKAYLMVAGGEAKTLSVVFADDTVTLIDATRLNKNEANSNAIFNLAGQHVAQPTKGIYVVGGKKVVVK